MNEKLQELLDGIQHTAIQAGGIASDAAYGVGKKATELLSTAKANIQICQLKADVNVCFREVGEMLYATHTGTPTDSDDLLKKLQEIDALKAEIDALSAQLGRESACPVCGAAAREGDKFCRECGSTLETPDALDQEPPAAPVTSDAPETPATEEDFAD